MDNSNIALLGNNEQILKFARIVENYAKDKDTGLYSNSGPIHAAIVLGNIFNNTEKSIYAFVEDLNGTVSNNPYCVQYFDKMLKNNDIDINYILRKNPLINADEPKKVVINKLLRRRDNDRGNTKLFILKNEYHNIFENNFTLSDEIAYRYEDDIKNYIAKFSFNDKKTSETLLDIFTVLKDKYSEELQNNP